MKRPIAIALTIAIFAAVAVCFLRPVDLNPGFGNVPEVAGYGCWEEITDCTGDTDLLTIDAIDWSRSTDGSIAVRTTPACFLSLTSQPLDSEGFATGAGDERGKRGYAEKLVGDSWEYVGEIGIEWVVYVFVMSFPGDPPRPDSSVAYVRPDSGLTFRELRVRLSEYKPGTTYRLTYFFRQKIESGWSDECYSVTHTVALPERSDKRLDFISLGWECAANTQIRPEIRVNRGTPPYLLLEACSLEHKENGQWIETIREKESIPELGLYKSESVFTMLARKYGPTEELLPCSHAPNHYNLEGIWALSIDKEFQNHRLTLVFCDNADGSGKQYTLVLNLDTTMLAEYK